jgi:phage baseplate assembly protein gpV
VSELIDTLRAIVRDELARMRSPELAIVLAVYANDADGNNHQVDVRLRASGVELQRVPVTVQRYGLSALPRVDDLVLVVFVGGELNAATVIGSIYDERTQPPEATPEEVVYQVPDAGGERHLYLETPGGMSCSLDDGALTIAAGGTQLTLEQDGNVKIQAAGNIELKADGDVTLEAGGKLVLKATTDIAIEGLNVKTQASAQAEIKSALIKVGGMAQFNPS